jgi:hypothetical protein
MLEITPSTGCGKTLTKEVIQTMKTTTTGKSTGKLTGKTTKRQRSDNRVAIRLQTAKELRKMPHEKKVKIFKDLGITLEK